MRAIYKLYVTNDIYDIYIKDKEVNKMVIARDILNNIIENDGYKTKSELVFPMTLKDIDSILKQF